MKKILSVIRNLLFYIALFFGSILFAVWIVLKTPFHYFTYRKSHYRRNIGEKFSVGLVDNPVFRLYELIQENALPISYLHSSDPEKAHLGAFVAGSTLLIHDLPYVYYNADAGCWSAYNNTESIFPIADTVAEKLYFLREEHPDVAVDSARILFNPKQLRSDDERARMAGDTLFISYSDMEELMEKLRQFCAES